MENIKFGNYTPPLPKKYFTKGWWTDVNNNPITQAKAGQKVRFHIQTEPDLPFDETFQYAVRDNDG